MKNSFAKFYSEHYDLFYQNKNYDSEARFIIKLIKKYKPDAINIRDAACGTCNHLIRFLNAGFNADGSDLSKDMLDLGRKKINALTFNYTPQLENKSMLDFSENKKYDAVMSLFASLNYLKDHNEINNFIKKCGRILNSKGLLIFDFWNGLLAAGNHGAQRKNKYKADDGFEIIRESTTTIDIIKQDAEVKYSLTKIKQKKAINNFSEIHKMHFFYPAEIKFMLEINNFKILQFSPVLKNSKFTTSDWELMIVAQKV